MTLHSGREISFECDGCDEVLKTESSDFTVAREKLKDAGWRAEKVAGEWLHECPQCRRKQTVSRR